MLNSAPDAARSPAASRARFRFPRSSYRLPPAPPARSTIRSSIVARHGGWSSTSDRTIFEQHAHGVDARCDLQFDPVRPGHQPEKEREETTWDVTARLCGSALDRWILAEKGFETTKTKETKEAFVPFVS